MRKKGGYPAWTLIGSPSTGTSPFRKCRLRALSKADDRPSNTAKPPLSPQPVAVLVCRCVIERSLQPAVSLTLWFARRHRCLRSLSCCRLQIQISAAPPRRRCGRALLRPLLNMHIYLKLGIGFLECNLPPLQTKSCSTSPAPPPPPHSPTQPASHFLSAPALRAADWVAANWLSALLTGALH